MNEHDLTALMERAGDGLAPDVEALVAGGAARGRRALRRRRVANGFGVAGAVGAIAVAATVLSGGGGTSSTLSDIVGLPSTTASADPRRELAEGAVIEERLLDALPGGDVTDLTVKTHPGERGALVGVQVRLLLDGAEVTMSIDDISRGPVDFLDPGPRPPECDGLEIGAGEGVITLDELEAALDELAARAKDDKAFRACLGWVAEKQDFECAQGARCWRERQAPPPCNGAGCIRLPDGSWMLSGTEATYEDDPDRPTEWRMTWATRATADHWWLDLKAGGPAKWAAPILSEEQVAALAKSDIWFE